MTDDQLRHLLQLSNMNVPAAIKNQIINLVEGL
jgi:hypothetical protein